MRIEELRAIWLSAIDRFWEGSWAGREDLAVVALDTDEPPGAEIIWWDGRPAIVVNASAALVPRSSIGS